MRIVTKVGRESTLTAILPKNSGRNNSGKVTMRHQGGRHKRYYREIDFRRDKRDIVGQVMAFEYDPNRNVHIALVQYTDGERKYILCPLGLAVGDKVQAGKEIDIKPGNALPLSAIPIGTPIHNIELHFGRGGQVVRGAGTVATILAKEGGHAQIKLPSSEVRKIDERCYATIGQLANIEAKSEEIGKAGRARHMGIRPTVRGSAMNPRSHPHGGGEGRSGEGMHPKTPWGKPARGLRTRKRAKYSDRFILQKRKK
jgi:large subunit ribosomal protein L2